MIEENKKQLKGVQKTNIGETTNFLEKGKYIKIVINIKLQHTKAFVP
jgi:hypothetical protein